MKNELISIIIPTYNRVGLLGETLDSIINQTYIHWECIIVDDGSTDFTKELTCLYCEKDNRFKFYKRPEYYEKGANACRNYGFEKSSGEYIQWLDDDDFLSNRKLELQIEAFRNNEVELSITNWKFSNFQRQNGLQNEFKGLKILNVETFYQGLTRGFTFVPPHAFLMTRKCVLKAGLWDTSLKINQDFEFFNRVLIQSQKLINIENSECFAVYRFHNFSRISNNIDDRFLENLIYGYRLAHAQLKHANIDLSNFFYWRLNNLYKKYKKNNMQILKRHKHFFKENKVDFNKFSLRNIKVSTYKIYYPLYKKLSR